VQVSSFIRPCAEQKHLRPKISPIWYVSLSFPPFVIQSSLAKGHHREPGSIEVLGHLHRTPPVESDLPDVVLRAEFFNEFLNEPVCKPSSHTLSKPFEYFFCLTEKKCADQVHDGVYCLLSITLALILFIDHKSPETIVFFDKNTFIFITYSSFSNHDKSDKIVIVINCQGQSIITFISCSITEINYTYTQQ